MWQKENSLKTIAALFKAHILFFSPSIERIFTTMREGFVVLDEFETFCAKIAINKN